MVPWKTDRKILLAVTGGISAYKAPDILRGLVKAGCRVEVVLTEDAERFVSPMVLSTLAGRRVWQQRDFLSDDHGWEIPHIALADWADAILVAPCTAETLANTAHGQGQKLVGALLLAAHAPVCLFPAMNVHMLDNPATAANIALLRERGYIVVDPESGSLACGYEGRGRLPSTEVILEELWRAISPSRHLSGKKVLVTAGPTWEFLDPVRFLSNPSTGKMGYAMARAAWYRGADVSLVLGPSALHNLYGFSVVPVVSAEDMKREVLARSDDMDVIVKAAAVGDFRPASYSGEKIKRRDRDVLSIELEQNPDIAAALGERKRTGQLLVGFAAESHNLLENAKGKIAKKNLDFIIANDITAPASGFGTDTNTVRVIDAGGACITIEGTKEDVAEGIWDILLGGWPPSS